jgi:hypothetical protein
MDEHGNHRYLTFQSGADLESNEVIGVVNPTLTVASDDREPARPDDSEEHAALSNTLIDHAAKVRSRPDVYHIHEDAIVAKDTRQVGEEPARFAFGVVAPVTDENCVCHASPLGLRELDGVARELRKARIGRTPEMSKPIRGTMLV